MIKKSRFASLLIIMALVSCSSSDTPKPEQKELSGSIEIKKAWARPATKGANTAVYLSIYNETAKHDTILKIQSEITDKSEVHESYTTEEGLSGMRPAKRLVIASGDSLVLKPGGMHIMLMNVQQELSFNDSLKIVVQLAKAGPKTILVPVGQQ